MSVTCKVNIGRVGAASNVQEEIHNYATLVTFFPRYQILILFHEAAVLIVVVNGITVKV